MKRALILRYCPASRPRSGRRHRPFKTPVVEGTALAQGDRSLADRAGTVRGCWRRVWGTPRACRWTSGGVVDPPGGLFGVAFAPFPAGDVDLPGDRAWEHPRCPFPQPNLLLAPRAGARHEQEEHREPPPRRCRRPPRRWPRPPLRDLLHPPQVRFRLDGRARISRSIWAGRGRRPGIPRKIYRTFDCDDEPRNRGGMGPGLRASARDPSRDFPPRCGRGCLGSPLRARHGRYIYPGRVLALFLRPRRWHRAGRRASSSLPPTRPSPAAPAVVVVPSPPRTLSGTTSRSPSTSRPTRRATGEPKSPPSRIAPGLGLLPAPPAAPGPVAGTAGEPPPSPRRGAGLLVPRLRTGRRPSTEHRAPPPPRPAGSSPRASRVTPPTSS